MTGTDTAVMDAFYLGGHPNYAASKPAPGRLCLRDDALAFEVMGEYFETLFSVPWELVTAWEVEGPSTATRRSSGGRAAVGALIAGIPGALIGMAATKEEFSAVLGVEVGDYSLGFLVRDRAPAALIVSLRRVEGVAALEASAQLGPPVRVSWEYQTARLDELTAWGAEGWEAVGVWQADDAPAVLLKRPRDHP